MENKEAGGVTPIAFLNQPNLPSVFWAFSITLSLTPTKKQEQPAQVYITDAHSTVIQMNLKLYKL